MDDFAPPSFSLGLDIDFDSDPQFTVREDPSSAAACPRAIVDDDFDTPMDPPRSLKRLRRGPTKETSSASAGKREVPESWGAFDDDIEEFSSQEDRPTDEPPPILHSVCGSSKFRLHGHGVLTTQSTKKKENTLQAPANMERSSKLTFPKLTTSPLRKFQLIDSDSSSDSDDPSFSQGENREANKSISSMKQRQSNLHRASVRDKEEKNATASVSRTEDLWENFFPEFFFHIQTPALDEVCEEYFGSLKNKNLTQSNIKSCMESSNVSKNLEQQMDMGNPVPPAHQYFFHDDPRIQELVRSRLPNYFPLCAVSNTSRQPSTSTIDYIGQFKQGEGSKQAAKKSKGVTSSTARKKSNAEEVSLGWVNPKSGAARGNPKDAGKRRVQADGESPGRWFMGPSGKRVYVNKSGKELTGKMAYIQYKKESGGGFKGTKRKRASKKKK